MQFILNPPQAQWPEILRRPVADASVLEPAVQQILDAVRTEGDAAVTRFAEMFDGPVLAEFLVPQSQFEAAEAALSSELKAAILLAANNIRQFHAVQLGGELVVETMPGVVCSRRSVGIERVGLYIPGGTAPLFSTVLMLGIPAQLAGCREIILCTPPQQNGNVHPAVLFAAQTCGITKVFAVGGVQAIAAMAYGTESIPKTYKIFGPGNQYVTCAKRLLARDGIAIDMPAGPSEVAVLADDSVPPAFVAADLLAQAEHGADSQVLLVATSETVLENVRREIELQLAQLPRRDVTAAALQYSRFITVPNERTAMQLLNTYSPEHLILACRNAELLCNEVINAGSVFVGAWSPESVGDYASGTNHTLPTNGFATAWSGVSVDSFVKKITFQQLTPQGLQQIGHAVETLAEAEGLQAHRNAVTVRLNYLSTSR
ncbi:MAG: histidinol dehydrogenase [Bacteroidia bacterium]|jgi:histidinol dehydrogenase|nr:histidinol dehydrogenase [Bacteroidia bacterium]